MMHYYEIGIAVFAQTAVGHHIFLGAEEVKCKLREKRRGDVAQILYFLSRNDDSC